jgi:type 1 glutamine amidotransferase
MIRNQESTMNRRELLKKSGAALAVGLFPLGWAAAADKPKRRILMFTRSEGYEHDVVKRKNGKLSLAESIVTDLGGKHGFDVKCEKDGRVFVNDDLSKYDAFLFETQGDLGKEQSKDGLPPVPPEGKKALLEAIAGGKGFVGCHCASDTYHSPGPRPQNQQGSQLDPYIVMVGGEFISHGRQQKGWMRVTDSAFPGAKGLKDFELMEEWYSLKNFGSDLHVILVQDTEGMVDWQYARPKFPATWARRHSKGRVFYTSMGHRDDVWKNPVFQELLLGGLSWAVGNVEADITPNLEKAAPQAAIMPKEPEKKNTKK